MILRVKDIATKTTSRLSIGTITLTSQLTRVSSTLSSYSFGNLSVLSSFFSLLPGVKRGHTLVAIACTATCVASKPCHSTSMSASEHRYRAAHHDEAASVSLDIFGILRGRNPPDSSGHCGAARCTGAQAWWNKREPPPNSAHWTQGCESVLSRCARSAALLCSHSVSTVLSGCALLCSLSDSAVLAQWLCLRGRNQLLE